MIDYTNQINLGRPMHKLQTELFELVAAMAKETREKGEKHWGLLLIVGHFAAVDYKLERYVQLGDNDLEGHPIMYGTKAFKEALTKHARVRQTDGAFLLDSASGQLMGNRVLYIDLKPQVQEERGARHHAAASASLDACVDFVITLSEETLTTRLYSDGTTLESREVDESVAVEKNNEANN